MTPPLNSSSPATALAGGGPRVAGLWPKRYDLMDGFRGLAALMVVCFHGGFLSFGHIGVSLFFVISGYCILASADSCLKLKAGAREFLVRRFHRIYPPYLCALLFFIVTRLLKIHFSHENQLAPFTVLQYIQNATFTQWLTLFAHPNINGDNPSLMVAAFWSLNYEIQFYAVVGVLLWLVQRTGQANLQTLIVALTAISFAWVLCVRTLCGLFIEYWPLFGCGCLVFMRLCKFKSRWSRLAVDGFLVVLVALSIIPTFHRPDAIWIFGVLTEPIMVGSCFCLIVVLLRPLSELVYDTLPGRMVAFLGVISYSLYLIHQFNLKLADSSVHHLLPAWTPKSIVITAIILFHIGLATVFWFFCERPFLNEKISLAKLFVIIRQKPAACPLIGTADKPSS